MEGIFPVTLSYKLKGNNMRLAFSGLVLKTIDDYVVWDTRDKKRNAAGADLTVEDETPPCQEDARYLQLDIQILKFLCLCLFFVVLSLSFCILIT